MKEELREILENAEQKIKEARNAEDVEKLRVEFLGKKGSLTSLLRQMKDLSAEERPEAGKAANEVRQKIEEKIAAKKEEMAEKQKELKLRAERIDVTLPGRDPDIGTYHPLKQVQKEIEDIFLGMGFEVVDGPEVEYDKYNFEMLNIPKGHPSRGLQDTFYINDNVLLRTQTSPMQIRTMLTRKPPIRIIAPGRVYRADEMDATHSPIFHQCEGMAIDKGITMADLKGTLAEFAKKMYGDDIEVRFRPHHFPFTEPSAEMDATCFMCHGKGCSLCKGEGFIEILGCGMIHPKVLAGCGIDPDVYTGWAFGMGMDRLAMLRYGVTDLRLMFGSDMRFLEQF
ncbi:MAG: phenylalanine--tRNA ligase subunit alpha [Oscillospiraceae bacterium]